MVIIFLLKDIEINSILQIDDLHISKNKVTCIIGRSGSGKTTLLRILNGMISPDQGEIYIEGQSISKLDLIQLRREIVMLQQAPAIFPGNIRDNLLIGLKFSNKPLVADDVLSMILKTVHLEKNLTDEAEDLSGGEKQRLALARVILMKPKVLLLDEPTSALDADTSKEMLSTLIRKFKENGQTVIIVTHSPEVVAAFADEVIEIEAGKILCREGDM